MNPLTNMRNVLKLSENELGTKNKTSWHDQYRDSAWLFIGGLPYDLSEGDIICIFSQNMRNVLKLSENELGTKNKTSWHDQYRDSAWLFIGGLPYDLSEGDIICIFSQYGEVVNINLVRDKASGKSKGFCFLCYEDQRSTVLAVDNFNGIKILGRIIRVDHVADYKVPKEGKKTDEETKQLNSTGCAPEFIPITKSPPRDYRETIADQIEADIKLPPRLPIYTVKTEDTASIKQEHDSDFERKKKKKSKKKHKSSDSEEDKERSKKHKHKKNKREVKYDLDEYRSSKKNKHSNNNNSRSSSSSRK